LLTVVISLESERVTKLVALMSCQIVPILTSLVNDNEKAFVMQKYIVILHCCGAGAASFSLLESELYINDIGKDDGAGAGTVSFFIPGAGAASK
jgi:hypothetical protein